MLLHWFIDQLWGDEQLYNIKTSHHWMQYVSQFLMSFFSARFCTFQCAFICIFSDVIFKKFTFLIILQTFIFPFPFFFNCKNNETVLILVYWPCIELHLLNSCISSSWFVEDSNGFQWIYNSLTQFFCLLIAFRSPPPAFSLFAQIRASWIENFRVPLSVLLGVEAMQTPASTWKSSSWPH